MKASVICRDPSGEVSIIPSKSVAHRALICAALSENPTCIFCDAESDDIDATVRCLTSLGTEIRKNEGVFEVSKGSLKRNAQLDCGESGSTLRFLIPVAATLDREITFAGSGRLPKRPIAPLISCLSENGAQISYDGALPLVVRGGLRSGHFKLPGDISSQFISGLIFALPLLSGDSEIEISGKTESGKYIDMTLETVSRFGIEVTCNNNRIYIKGNQKYVAPERFVVEGDWSNAAFWAALGAFSEKGITCSGINHMSVQGDKEILPILKRFGAEVIQGESYFTVRKKTLCATDIDAAEIPDLVPVLSIVAAAAKGETVIDNIQRLRIKESDRVEAVIALISALGGKAETRDNKLIIHGQGRLFGGMADGKGDHRIVMSAAIAAAAAKGEKIEISGAEAVKKSYGDFFEKYSQLGAQITGSEE